MQEQPLKTQSMKISKVRANLNTLVNEVYRNETRVLVEKSGIPVAGIISVADLERLERLDRQDQEAWEILEAMRAPFRDVAPEEIEREANRAVAEIRAERRAKQAETATRV